MEWKLCFNSHLPQICRRCSQATECIFKNLKRKLLILNALSKHTKEKVITDKLRGYFRHWYISCLTRAKILDSKMTGVETKENFEDWMWRKTDMTNISTWRYFLRDKRRFPLRHRHREERWAFETVLRASVKHFNLFRANSVRGWKNCEVILKAKAHVY